MQSCPSCGTESRDDLKFCTDCGTPLETWDCSECETENSWLGKFCTNCGAPLQLSEKKSPIASAGQVLIKVIIVLAGAVGLIILLCVILLVFILSTVEC